MVRPDVTTTIDIAPGSPAAGVPMPQVSDLLRPGTLSLPALPPLSLYVHFPWCVRKCPYCDFNSHEPDAGGFPESRYLDAVAADIEASLPLVWGRPVISVFIGGGTPSLMSAAGVERLLSDIRARLPLEADCEITMEANPGTFEADRFAAYRAAGVNRLSIGVQSFDAGKLGALGRIHDRSQAVAAIGLVQRVFTNFNLDLMFGLPGQSLDEARADLETALAFAPPHLSLYQLTLEPNTVFAKFPPALPDDDTVAGMQEWIEARAREADYHRYEVSAYARPGRECRHNMNYWRFGDYLGVGAGAHSKISFPHRILRQVRFRQPSSYLERAGRGEFLAENVEVSRRDLPFEFMLNALRLSDGVPARLFAERTGLPASAIDDAVTRAELRGLIEPDPLRLAPTELGRRFLTDLQSMFLPSGRP
jgi:putative oxygen-independent coproporphyrinogen III oxidase